VRDRLGYAQGFSSHHWYRLRCIRITAHRRRCACLKTERVGFFRRGTSPEVISIEPRLCVQIPSVVSRCRRVSQPTVGVEVPASGRIPIPLRVGIGIAASFRDQAFGEIVDADSLCVIPGTFRFSRFSDLERLFELCATRVLQFVPIVSVRSVTNRPEDWTRRRCECFGLRNFLNRVIRYFLVHVPRIGLAPHRFWTSNGIVGLVLRIGSRNFWSRDVDSPPDRAFELGIRAGLRAVYVYLKRALSVPRHERPVTAGSFLGVDGRLLVAIGRCSALTICGERITSTGSQAACNAMQAKRPSQAR